MALLEGELDRLPEGAALVERLQVTPSPTPLHLTSIGRQVILQVPSNRLQQMIYQQLDQLEPKSDSIKHHLKSDSIQLLNAKPDSKSLQIQLQLTSLERIHPIQTPFAFIFPTLTHHVFFFGKAGECKQCSPPSHGRARC